MVTRAARQLAACIACLAIGWLIASTCHAQAAPSSSAGVLDFVLDQYKAAASQWASTMQKAADWLFWTLAAISMAWTFGMLLLRRADIMEFFAEAIRFIVFVGFFFWLLDHAVDISEAILSSMRQLAAQAGHTKNDLSPSGIIDVGFEVFFYVLGQSSVWSPIDSLFSFVLALFILLLFATIALEMLVLLISCWFLLYAGIFFLGFGGSRWTSDMAITYYRTVLSLGVQSGAMILITSIGKLVTQHFYTGIDDKGFLFALAVLLVVAYAEFKLTRQIPPLLGGLVTGASSGAHSSAGSTAGALFSMTAAGAAGAAFGIGGSMLASAAANLGGAISAVRAATGAARSELSKDPAGGAGGSIGPLASAFGDRSASQAATTAPATSAASRPATGASAGRSESKQSQAPAERGSGATASTSANGARNQAQQKSAPGVGTTSGAAAAASSSKSQQPGASASANKKPSSTAANTAAKDTGCEDKPKAEPKETAAAEADDASDARDEAASTAAGDDPSQEGADDTKEGEDKNPDDKASPSLAASQGDTAANEAAHATAARESTPPAAGAGGATSTATSSAAAGDASASASASATENGPSSNSRASDKHAGASSTGATAHASTSAASSSSSTASPNSASDPAATTNAAAPSGDSADKGAVGSGNQPSSLKTAVRAGQILAAASGKATAGVARGVAAKVMARVAATPGGRLAAQIREDYGSGASKPEPPSASEVDEFRDRSDSESSGAKDRSPAQELDATSTSQAPMTAAQAAYLEGLCAGAKQDFDPNLSKADASQLIDQLRRQRSTGVRGESE